MSKEDDKYFEQLLWRKCFKDLGFAKSERERAYVYASGCFVRQNCGLDISSTRLHYNLKLSG